PLPLHPHSFPPRRSSDLGENPSQPTRPAELTPQMALDLIALGTVPSGEAAAAASDVDYGGRAFWQCRRFIDLLRRTVGAEPEGEIGRAHVSTPVTRSRRM